MKVFQAVAAALVAEDVRVLFAVMGDGNMYMLAELAGNGNARIVHARHEAGAVGMADGFARATGTVGVATVTCGPGLTQSTTALTAAVRHGTPLVLIAGDTAQSNARSHQRVDQAEVVRSTGADFLTVRQPRGVLDGVRTAFQRARRHRCPVVLSIPVDVLDAEIVGTSVRRRVTDSSEPDELVNPDDRAVKRIAKRLEHAERPLLLAGRGVVRAGAREQIVDLAGRTGAAMATTLRAKGLFDGQPMSLGLAGGFALAPVRRLLGQADLVVAVGASLSLDTTDGGTLFRRANIVQVVDDLPPLSEAADDVVLGDAQLTLRRVSVELGDRMGGSGWDPEAIREAREAALGLPAGAPEPGALEPAEVLREVDRVVPRERRIVVGVGHFWSYAVTHLQGRDPDRYVFAYDFGAIGQALPQAIGVAVGVGEPVVVIEGDGSLLMNVQELETVSRERIPLHVVVMNDGAYGAEVHKLAARGMDGDLARFGRPDFAGLAQSFGLQGVRLSSTDQLASHLSSSSSTAVVIDVPMSARAISPHYRRAYFNET